MIDTKSELRYILLVRLLEKAAAGHLTTEELYAAKRLARDGARRVHHQQAALRL